uniref:Uncharacterized protein n=1 Tax=viral metagenome TaxID=1070528 RepID=A0A6M3J5W1_9ZZZZ
MIAHALTWLASPHGRLVAAVVLFGLVALLERTPWIADKLDGRPVAKRVVAVTITVAGAAATAIWSGVPLVQVGEAAVTALLVATGANEMVMHSLKDKLLP